MNETNSPNSPKNSYYSRRPSKARRIVRNSSGCGCRGGNKTRSTENQNQIKTTSDTISLPVIENHETINSMETQTQLLEKKGDPKNSTSMSANEETKLFSKETNVQELESSKFSSWLKTIVNWLKNYWKKEIEQ